MIPAPDQDEHRHFTRIPFTGRVELRTPTGEWQCELLDVSLRGVLVARPEGWNGRRGDTVLLEITLDSGEIRIHIETVVAHLEAGRAGFTIRHIDVDSLAHLRRLVELNLGDEAKLHRELAAMLSAP